MQHLGNVNRFTQFKFREIVNYDFLDFCEHNKVQFDHSYRQVVRNIEAGYKSVAKYDRPQPRFRNAGFKMACEWLRTHFAPYVMGTRVLSQEETLKQMEMATAAGYPWNLVFHSKREMIEAGCSDVLEWYWNLISTTPYQVPKPLRIPQRYHPFWLNTEKAELRELKKLIENRNRTYTAIAIELGVAANRMCLDFNEQFYNARETCSFVGRSKFYQGWNVLYMRLSKFPEGYEFDVKEFDSSAFSIALYDQMEFRWECMLEQTKENRMRLTNIYGEIVNSVIVLEGEENTNVAEVVLKNTGNPSGQVNTIVDNTMFLYRIFAYCWLCSAPSEFLALGYAGFRDHVEAALNGDDNTMTVSPLVTSFFNSDSIIKYALELGIIITTPNMALRPYLELSFLSQNAVELITKYGKWILPAPDYDKVLCSLTYGSDEGDIRWHLLRALALLMDSWANVRLRAVLKLYIKTLIRRNRDTLMGTINGVPMSEIFAMIKSDDWYFALYTGIESGVGALKDSPHKIFQCQRRVNHSPCLNMNKSSSSSSSANAKKQKKQKTGKNRGKGKESRNGKDELTMPLAHQKRNRTKRPKISNGPKSDGSIIVRHREYLVDVTGTELFTPAKLRINPGLSGCFPWLSTIAPNYETYNFRKLKFEYNTGIGATHTGKFFMGIDYDSGDTSPTAKMELLAYHDACDTPVWGSVTMTADHRDLHKFKTRYVRNYNISAGLNDDVTLYDVGALYYATAGCDVTTGVGELYVEYEVELNTPTMNLKQLAYAGTRVFAGNVNIASPWAATGGGLDIVADGKNIIFYQPGYYLISGIYNGVGITAHPLLTGTVTVDGISDTVINSAGTAIAWRAAIIVHQPAQHLETEWTTTCTSISYSDAIITRYRGSL